MLKACEARKISIENTPENVMDLFESSVLKCAESGCMKMILKEGDVLYEYLSGNGKEPNRKFLTDLGYALVFRENGNIEIFWGHATPQMEGYEVNF